MTFLEALRKHTLILDGAMGSMVQKFELPASAYGGMEYAMLSDLLVFSRPEMIRDGIHLEYLKAGANILETNTFGACPLRLEEFDFSRIDTSDFHGLPAGFDLKTASREEIARQLNLTGVRLAQEAIAKFKQMPEYDGLPLFVSASIGPSNRVISPTAANLQKTDFASIKANFRVQCDALVEAGCDVFLFETQQDILELKASIAAAHEANAAAGKRIPIMAQVTADEHCKMQIFNTDIVAAIAAVDKLGIDVFGINCTLGPELMGKLIPRLAEHCSLPISVVPNAGQPVSVNGKTVYPLQPEKMGELMRDFHSANGINIVGGCCGTTPDHIRAIAKHIRGLPAPERKVRKFNFVSGPQQAFDLKSFNGLIRIGERLNCRGSKKVRDAVENSTGKIDMEALEEVASEQVKDLGVEIIDVCMDSNQVDTPSVLPKVVHGLTADFKAAMCIDSFDVEALARAIDVYAGRPIINSISLEEYAPGVDKIDAVVPITKHHAPLYIALLTDGEGPAVTREKKLELAQQIVAKCATHGITPDQLFIDINAFPIGSESVEGLNFALESLESLPAIKALHPEIMTSIGVGNLTNGLAKKPYMRTVLTSVFIDEGRKRGLDAAIINPHHYVPVDSLDPKHYQLGLRAVLQRDMDAFAELEVIAEARTGKVAAVKTAYADMPLEKAICEKIKDGVKTRAEGVASLGKYSHKYSDSIVAEVAQVLAYIAPLDFINKHLMVAMRDLGDGFGRGEVSLPHLLKAADIMKHCMGFIEGYLKHESGADQGEITYKGTFVIGTVYQDVHSIGKDLAKTLLENYGFRVIDLGVQVPLEKFIDTAVAEKADAIGMSALLVQTSNHMITVQKMLKERGLDLPLLIGGAPVSTRHAASVAMWGQDDFEQMNERVFYCQSGMDGVNIMNILVDAEKRDALIRDNAAKLKKFYRLAKEQAERAARENASLPLRQVDPWERGRPARFAEAVFGPVTYSLTLTELKEFFDLRTLYGLNWDFGGAKQWTQKGMDKTKLDALRDEWVARSEKEGWIKPAARIGVFPCQADGFEAVLFDPADTSKEIGRLLFNEVFSQTDKWHATQYLQPLGSKDFDLLGLQISTGGRRVEERINQFRNEGDLEACFLLQGLSDRVAEDMAEQAHAEIRRRLKLDPKQGCRYSPGYPAMLAMAGNATIHRLLKAEELGIALTDADEFAPTSTTAAVCFFHPKASYS
jgi:5-methyltetrahydrofolate--homocysteine methyltransferase